jgi:O-antigen/teichoic acid export membrane protein
MLKGSDGKPLLRLRNYLDRILSPFLKDVISTVMIQILIMVLNILILKIASIKMTIDEFGLFNVAKRSASLAAYILMFGLGISLPRFISSYRSKGDETGEKRILLAGTGMVFFLSLLGLLLAFYGKKTLATLLFGNSGLSGYVVPVMLNVVGITMSTFITAYYRGINHLWLFNLIQFLMQLFVLLIILLITSDPIKLIGWWGISWIIFSLLFFIHILIHHPGLMRSLPNPQIIKGIVELIHFGAPRIVGEFALFGYFAVPLIILSSRHELSSVALVSVPISFFQLIGAVFGFAGYVLLPHVSAGMVNGNFQSVKQDIRKMEIIYLITSIAIVIVMLISAPLLTRLFFSADYSSTVPYTRIMCIGIIPYAFYLLYRNPLDAVSHFPWNSINLVIGLVIVTVSIKYSHSLQSYTLAYAGSASILGILTWRTWKKVIRPLNQ